MARILIIDDEAPMRRMVRGILEQAGYEVVEADEGCAGMQRHEDTPAEMILTDLFMAGQEGLETIKRLRQMDPQVKIIAMSGGGKVGFTEDFLELAALFGAKRTLQKPFSQEELLDAVWDVLQSE